MYGISEDFIRAVPKTDLHVHIDGSLRLSTLIELAKELKVKLPSYTVEGLKKLVFKEHYQSLIDYLRGFKYTDDVMQNAEALERIAYELALDCFADGVRYIEPRFAPQLHANKDFSIEDVLEATNRGLAKAKKEINNSKQIKDGKEPPFAYGIIGCALRMFNEHYSDYYDNFVHAHLFSTDDERFAMASLELAKALIRIRDAFGIPIVAFDLAGAEAGYPAENHQASYQYVHKNFLKKTVHAGEAYGAASIFQAITDLHADRIGHGTYLFDETKVELPTKDERKKYIYDLSQYIADSRITLEISLTSNLQTNPELRDISKHPCKKMLDQKLSVTFCTDNRLISNTTSTKEFKLAADTFGLNREQLKDIIAYGFKRSFYPGEYSEKRAYVRQVLNFYEKLENKFFKA
ncbi:MAG: adenosine deaminase family protein [Deltaproteobacteria bacterium]|nr:adenosine deaminase family protein [Deltaproteobacteria bacterium]MBI2974301.1 adenosine deaminase family protein [Deltaproteobacteria bacterium]